MLKMAEKGGREGVIAESNFLFIPQRVKWRFDNYLINFIWVNSLNGTWLNEVDSKNVVLGPAACSSPENLLEMQILASLQSY